MVGVGVSCLQKWEILEDPKRHVLQYANRVPVASLFAPAISAQDGGKLFSHLTQTQTQTLSNLFIYLFKQQKLKVQKFMIFFCLLYIS